MLKLCFFIRPCLDVPIRIEVTHDVTLCPALIANVPSLIARSLCSSLVLWSQAICVVHVGGLCCTLCPGAIERHNCGSVRGIWEFGWNWFVNIFPTLYNSVGKWGPSMVVL